VTVIILAGQRAGIRNPLAAAAGVSHKCLVPIAGKPLIEHVFAAVAELSAIHEIVVSLEEDAHDAVAEIAARAVMGGTQMRFVPAREALVDSILAAVEGARLPVVITTADNVLLTAEGFDAMRGALGEAEVVFALARREDVLAAHPDGQRNFYRFRDGEFANCNIYALKNEAALACIGVFSEGGQFMKSKMRMVRAFGLFNIIGLALRRFTSAGAARRIGTRFGAQCARVVMRDGSLAIDVDNARTYECCETILERRADRARTAQDA
jgi:GTP:adenosylcobinamide-phosphate guanylyltransferase